MNILQFAATKNSKIKRVELFLHALKIELLCDPD